MKTYTISDQHFFHANIIQYCSRPFKDEYHMNDTIVDNYNRIVSKNDTCIHLGDLSAGLEGRHDEFMDILMELNGNKILLLGNHDHEDVTFYEKCGFTVGTHLVIGDTFLCHYPIFTKSKYSTPIEKHYKRLFEESKCTKIIHGHNHNNFSDSPTPKWSDGIPRWNCSVEANGYTPVLLDTITKTVNVK